MTTEIHEFGKKKGITVSAIKTPGNLLMMVNDIIVNNKNNKSAAWFWFKYISPIQ